MKIEINYSDLWKLLPGKYRYIAQDENGMVCAYVEKPRIGYEDWRPVSNFLEWQYTVITDAPGKNPNWMNTLQERPKNQAQ